MVTAPAPAVPVTPPDAHRSFRMVPKHNRLTDLYSEWCGLGRYKDDYGGIAGRDKLYKGRWRKHLHAMHYSRAKRTVAAIEEFAKQHELQPLEACSSLEPAFEASKFSTGNFVQHCQAEGLLKRRKARGHQVTEAKAAAATQSPPTQ